MNDYPVEEIVHLAFEAGRESMAEEVCEDMGHDWRTNDQSDSEGGQVDVQCIRCGKKFQY